MDAGPVHIYPASSKADNDFPVFQKESESHTFDLKCPEKSRMDLFEAF